MAIADIRDRLQPALLDRLIVKSEAERVKDPDANDDRRVMTKAQLRAAVLRDLGWLFNATQPLGREADGNPLLAGSVLNFGLPALSGHLASQVDIGTVVRSIHDAIVRFEPRILPETLEVRALEATSLLDTHNVIEFEIRGQLWSEPVPLEILLRTQLDLEAGQVQVRDTTGAAPARTR